MTSHTHPCDNAVIHYQSLNASHHTGRLIIGNQSWHCIIGKNGCKTIKREGDLATPTGQLPILEVLYRADKIARPKTSLPLKIIKPNDGWCDEIGHANYNRPVKRPFLNGHEALYRNDSVYDICVVLDYNISARKQGRGSAIFFHLIRPDHKPTEGCLAVSLPDMVQILKKLTPNSAIII